MVISAPRAVKRRPCSPYRFLLLVGVDVVVELDVKRSTPPLGVVSNHCRCRSPSCTTATSASVCGCGKRGGRRCCLAELQRRQVRAIRKSLPVGHHGRRALRAASTTEHQVSNWSVPEFLFGSFDGLSSGKLYLAYHICQRIHCLACDWSLAGQSAS